MASPLSVIVCTHNPREEYLSRTLKGLREQTLTYPNWELIVIDNASVPPISGLFDLSWHKSGRIIREDQLGLTNARLSGIDAAQGDLLVFVDDDNILACNYLALALHQFQSMPWLGSWGGQVDPEFEAPPPKWIRRYLPYLAINEVPCNQWSNFTNPASTPPCGAGMCVRRQVARSWSENVKSSALRVSLGRSGASLASCEDIDLAFTACDLGLATGRFQELRLTHLIPEGRLQLQYVARLVESTATSQVLLRSLREKVLPPRKSSLKARLVEIWRDWQRQPEERVLLRAEQRGRAKGFEYLAKSRPEKN